VRRLLEHQYVDSVGIVFGSAAAAAADPPDDPSIGKFDAMGTLTSVPAPADIELYEGSSAAIADAVVADPSHIAATAPCVVDGPTDESCYASVASDLGRMAWRRPLTTDEIERLVAVATTAQEWGGGDFAVGLRYQLMAMLQSPYFLYVVEVGQEGDDGERQLDGYEMATRLSLMIVGHTPDAELLAAAEAGELDTEAGVRAMATQLLDRPESTAVVRNFFGEYLHVRDLPTKGKATELFPLWSQQLAVGMVEETMRVVDDVFEGNDSVLELLTADYTWVNDDLAALYGVEATGEWHTVTLPGDQNRMGVLTQAAWLSQESHPNVNSPTRRGLFVAEQMLCQEVPLPPPRANPQPVVPDPGVTLREALSQHVEDPACYACHQFMDPIGFAFENYDPIGGYRTTDNGFPVDATGAVDGLGDFANAAELSGLLAADPRVPRCLVNKVYTQGLGWVPEVEQVPALDAVNLAYGDGGHTMRRLMIELVASPIFRTVGQAK